MKFTSDRQRRAVFSRINSQGNSLQTEGVQQFASMFTVGNKFSDKLTPSEKQKSLDDLRYLKEQFDLGTISQRQYAIGINSLKQPEKIKVIEEPVYEMTVEDYEWMYPSQEELDRRHKEENERYLKLYGKTKDEIDYDFGDNNVMWTAEMGATTRNQYLDMLRGIKSRDCLRNNNIGVNVGKKAISRMASYRDNRVGSDLMDIYI